MGWRVTQSSYGIWKIVKQHHINILNSLFQVMAFMVSEVFLITIHLFIGLSTSLLMALSTLDVWHVLTGKELWN